MKNISNHLSFCALCIFLIALCIYIYIYIKDKELTDKDDRSHKDNVWILVFLSILVIGLVITLYSSYRSYYPSNANPIDFNVFSNKSKKCSTVLRDFVGIPQFNKIIK